MAEEAATTVGETVRKLRLWRGKDQETLAGLVGRSQAWLSNVESGKTRLDRRTDIEALADALEVYPLDIVGKSYRTAGRQTYEVEALVPAIRWRSRMCRMLRLCRSWS
jgi:transcriptional regulator with XRE-family HTH domain